MIPETDVGTIRLIIKSAMVLALFCLLAGIGLAFNSQNENAVIVAACGALLAVPGNCMVCLFTLLAKTSTTRPSSGNSTTNSTTMTVTAAEQAPAEEKEK